LFDDDGIVVGVAVDKKDERRRATYEDVLNAPEHKVAEIIDGVLYLSPRPAPPQAGAKGALFGDLFNPYARGRGGPGDWRLFFEPELHFGEDVVVPDIAGWRRSRMPELPTGVGTKLAPDWLCETLSAPTIEIDRAKLDVYAREGVPHVWLVDPEQRTLELLVLRGSSLSIQATYHGRERVRAEPFDAVEIELAFLWGERPELSGSLDG
jgi:Uma2 family endonuclease